MPTSTARKMPRPNQVKRSGQPKLEVAETLFAPAQKPPRAFEEIIKQVQILIAGGRIKRGEKLPTERQLALQFQVGRNTVREALRMLEISGTVVLRRGPKGGAFVVDDDPHHLNQHLTNALRLTDFSVADLTQAMRSITIMLFEAAAASATKEDLDAIDANIRKAEATEDPHKRSIILIQFYSLLAEASGNKILVLIANVLVEILRNWVVRLGPIDPKRVIRSRRAIASHLRAGDSRAAFKEIKQFLNEMHRSWLLGEGMLGDVDASVPFKLSKPEDRK